MKKSPPHSSRKKTLFPPFDVMGFVLYLQKRASPNKEVQLSLRQIKSETGSDVERIRHLIAKSVDWGYIRYRAERGLVSKFKLINWI